MAGQPRTRQMLAKIEALGADALLERIASGQNLKSLAEQIGVSRQVLSGFLNSPERREALRSAREAAADTLAEECLEIADAAQPQTERVAKLQIDTRRWLASKWDRTLYGDQPGVNVNINLAQLHLDSLRKSSSAEQVE